MIQFYMDNGKPAQAAQLAELALQYSPKDIAAWLYKSNAYKKIIRRDFMSHYRTSKEIPADQFPRFNELADRAMKAERRAFELGFEPPPESDGRNYMSTVNKANSDFKNNQK
ncbi:hypothetical protein ACQUJT_13945 [Ralstonia pseudosolanacearum]